jgi:nucleotide-binding universal stress UspA family protein
MTTILAAVDDSPAQTAVLATADALAALLGAEVAAVHVPERDRRATDVLLEAADAADVVALVIAARAVADAPHALGRAAAALVTRSRKPVLVVPPELRPPVTLHRVLVPIEGAAATVPTPGGIFELTRGIDVLALHVLDEDALPAFTDQPQHEQAAWAREFLARYCPRNLASVRLESRVGRVAELVPLVAEQQSCDLVALGWSQELAPGRAAVVRATLERSPLPVLLVPARLATAAPGE